MVNTEDSEDSEAAREEVESPTNREKIEESQKLKGRIPSINLATNNFEEAETGTKMADNLDHRKMTIEVSKDNELEKKMELIKKMLMNWKVVITANRREEEMYYEEFERGLRRMKYLGKLDGYFKKISEEVEKIEEGKVDEKRLEAIIDVLIIERWLMGTGREEHRV